MRTRCSGWSLLEILMSMILSSILLTLILKIYSIYIQANSSLQRMLHEYAEYNFIYRILTHSMQRAGFTPCKSLNSLQSKENLQSFKIFAAGIQINSMYNPIAEINIIDNKYIIWPGKIKLNLTNTYLIADCYHAELITLQSMQEEQGKKILQLIKPLTQEFVAPIYMGVWLSETVSLQKSHSALVLHSLQTDTVSTAVKKIVVQAKKEEQNTFFITNITMHSGRAYKFKTQIHNRLPKKSHEKGFVLLVVLWLIIVLMLLSIAQWQSIIVMQKLNRSSQEFTQQ